MLLDEHSFAPRSGCSFRACALTPAAAFASPWDAAREILVLSKEQYQGYSHSFARGWGHGSFRVLSNLFPFGYRRELKHLELLGQSVRDQLGTQFKSLALSLTPRVSLNKFFPRFPSCKKG